MITTLLLTVLVIAILVVAFLFVWRARKPATRAEAASPNGKAPSSGPVSAPDRELLEVKAGDVVALWSGEELLVETVLSCRETLPGRQAAWRWVFLEGGRVLSSVGMVSTYYPETEVLFQGTEGFERLTSDASQGGALKTFEERVRENTVGSSPVFFGYAGKDYRVQSTGTFSIPGQEAPAREVWQDVSPNEGDNVYFRLASDDGEQILGIWTSHIAILKGRVLAASDIREVYRTGR